MLANPWKGKPRCSRQACKRMAEWLVSTECVPSQCTHFGISRSRNHSFNDKGLKRMPAGSSAFHNESIDLILRRWYHVVCTK
jgi:hypothetical protein